MKRDGTIKVLLLEDDADDYRLAAKQMCSQRWRFVVDWAQTLAAALEKLARQSYDVVLSDLMVPDSKGLPTVLKLRKACGQTPIIVLTSLDDDWVESDVLGAGAQDLLVKDELAGRAASRAILHAVQRQHSLNEVNALVSELEQNHQLMRKQARLLRQKNRRLRRLYKTAQEIVDNVSHDFRTPLTVINDYVAIIREGMVGSINDEQRAMLDKVTLRADDLNNMVDDLLDASKLQSGLLGTWRRNVKLHDVLDRSESLLQHRARVKNVELVVDRDPLLPDVYCDTDKVGRVITNLAVNAIKFSPEGGRVRIWTEAVPEEHAVRIHVTDNGPGIDRQSLDTIFKRFQQLGPNCGPKVHGYGLGLDIAQQLCRLNLGELSVQSQIGKGSTFSFTLPTAEPVEVLHRWLVAPRSESQPFSLVEITTACDDPSDADDFDGFLNCLLRSDSLLFRLASDRWLLVMAVAPVELGCWFQRAKHEYDRQNRNRPLGRLPDYEARTRYQWEQDEPLDETLRAFETVARESVECAVTV